MGRSPVGRNQPKQTALSLGERVSRSGAFTSRSETGEGSLGPGCVAKDGPTLMMLRSITRNGTGIYQATSTFGKYWSSLLLSAFCFPPSAFFSLLSPPL